MNLFQTEMPTSSVEEEDFNPGVDSTVLIPEMTRGSKLEGTFAKKKGHL